MRHLASILIALLTLPALPAIAQTADPLPLCEPTIPSFAKVIEIDAATLGTTRPPDPLRLRDEVTVLVVNKNPLLFDYRLEGREVVVADTGLAEGIAMLFPFAKAFGGADETKDTPEQPLAATGTLEAFMGTNALLLERSEKTPKADPCAPLQRRLDEIDDRHRGLKNLRETTFAKASAAVGRHAIFIERTTATRTATLTAGLACPDLKTAITGYRGAVTAFAGSTALPDLAQAIRSLRSALDTQATDLATLPQAARALAWECRDRLEPSIWVWEQRVAGYRADLADFEVVQKRLTSDLATAEKNVAAINAALSQAQPAFFSLLEFGPYERPTDVFVKLSSRPAADPKATYAQLGEWKLNFGGAARFALAAGAAYSRLGTRTFERVHGFARDREGAIVIEDGDEVSGQIVGIDEESNQRVGPLVMLHTRLGSRFRLFGSEHVRTAFHLSFGLSAGIVDDDLTGNLLVGPSLSFAEERLFLTAGGYYGNNQTLGGNLFVGGLVPEEVTEIPVVREGHWKFGAAVTYRFEVGKKED